jgi:hypothetical protein
LPAVGTYQLKDLCQPAALTLLRCSHERCSLVSYLEPKATVDLLIHVDLKYSDDLFNYTRGRFVCDERYEMSQRQVRFNVNELARRAAEAIGAKTCVNIEKYPDGMYNKSMLLTMDNGSQVVAKVPNPNAGMPHFTTASEVATMDFVCSLLMLLRLDTG